MPGERLILNPVSEDSTNAPLELVGPDGSIDWGVLLMSHVYEPPERSTQYAGSSDTEGDPLANTRYTNRQIGISLRVAEPSQGTGTNLATNPRAAVGTTGWTNSGLASMTREVLDQTGAPIGLQGAETALRATGNSDTDVGYLSAAVTSGSTYRFSAYVYLNSNTATGVKLSVRNASGTLKASSSTLSTTGAWTRLDVSVTADATATWRFGIEQIGAGAADASVTMALIEQSSSLGPYFDGDTPGCDWSGTRHESSSTRPATGGDRFYAILDDLQSIVDRIVREGGTLKRVPPGGKPIVFDLVDAQVDIPSDNAFINSRRAVVTLTFTAKPFWRRGEWIQLADNTETSAPYMAFTYTGIQGEVPALGKLVIDEDQGQTQRWLAWGQESRYYSSSANAGVFYEAEGRTVKGNAAIATTTGASGGATNNSVKESFLINGWQQILSTQATSAGDHLSHIGKWRVFARVQGASGNTGTLAACLEWAQGDFRRATQNEAATLTTRSDWELIDLGVVTIDKVTQGTQRWEGRVLAKSTAIGDDFVIDYLWLCPVTDGAGEVTASSATSTSYSKLAAYDAFNQTAGSISGKTASLGGNWASTGDATDFAVVAGTTKALRRSELSDSANTGRYAYVGASNIKGSQVSVDTRNASVTAGYHPSATVRQGVLLRYTDSNNWLMASLYMFSNWTVNLEVRERVAGTITTLSDTNVYPSPDVAVNFVNTSAYLTVVLAAYESGDWTAAVKKNGATIQSASGYRSSLAAGGALESGKGGVYDENQDTSYSSYRDYDNFSVEEFSASDSKLDAAVFASQSAELRYDTYVREDAAGTVWSAAGKYEGDLLRIPVAGRDNRSNRFTLKAARYGPGAGADSAFDDISARLSYQPRGITTPDPS